MFDLDLPRLLRTLLLGVLVYSAVVLILRLSGKRTLSKWNSFDLIVTVALGSSLATALLTAQVSLPQGVLALALLTALQFAVTWLSVRVASFERLIKARPTLLVRDGELLHDAMRRERVPVSEIHAALRAHGIGSLDGVAAVVLETDGSFSVVRESVRGTALQDVEGYSLEGRKPGSTLPGKRTA